MSHHLFDEKVAVPIFLRPLGKLVRDMARCLNHMYGANGVAVYPNEHGGLEIDASPGSGALGSSTVNYPGCWAPGEIDDTAGTIVIGRGIVVDTTRTYKVGPRAVTVAGGTTTQPTYIYLEIPHESGSASIASTSIANLPTPTLTVYRIPLLEVAKISGRIVVVDRLCKDTVSIPGLLGSS
ncbi:MAG TPA: hypothetical protein PKC67_02620 [Kiritimatiellia bacterium]|nr:hypothetical protein [Kiritimatiellia bacterium]HMP33220.1 hypothetical protein [Kiritimatiellia bacterium]